MKTRWFVLSLALVAVAAVAAVAFSSQPGETSHGVSRGIILWVLDWLHLEVSEETMGWINYFLRRGAHLTIYFCMGLGLALAFQWQKKVAPWIPAMTLGWFSQPPMNCTSSTRETARPVLGMCCWIPWALRRGAQQPGSCGVVGKNAIRSRNGCFAINVSLTILEDD